MSIKPGAAGERAAFVNLEGRTRFGQTEGDRSRRNPRAARAVGKLMTPGAVGWTLAIPAAAALLAFPPSISAQRPSPGVRNAHASVYDPRTRALLVFGGATATEVRADLWRWRAGAWHRSPATGPEPRTFPAMAYHSARDEVVLFGGSRVLFGDGSSRPAMLGDTWVFRNGEWSRAPDGGPGPRAESAIAYDPVRARTVLFGGYHTAGDDVTRLGDTWEWDGRRWTRVSTDGPSPRSGAAMAWHPELRAVVLFGGSGGPLGDTWSWDGRAWTLLRIPPAPGRFNTVMSWDPSTRRLVRFGGWDGKGRTSDTWELCPDRWVLAESDGPSPRNHAVMVSAPDRGSVLLFGGHDGELVFGDLWERRNGRWVRLESAQPIRRAPNDH